MRPLDKVLEAVIYIIPEGHLELITALFKIRESYWYTAPELWSMRWSQAQETLQTFLGDPDTDWKKTVEGVMNSTIDYRNYLQVEQ